MPESAQSCFELSIHLSVFFFSRELFLVAVHGRFAIQINADYLDHLALVPLLCSVLQSGLLVV